MVSPTRMVMLGMKGPSGSRVLSNSIPLFPRMRLVRGGVVRVHDDHPTCQDSRLTQRTMREFSEF
jgi:hypothetical protein